MFGAGGVIGAVSAIVGIGGGTLTVPFLAWCNVAMRNAVANSSACGLPIAVAGAIDFVVAGWNQAALPDWSTGYVYWPAFAGIVAASVLFAPLGAWLAHRLPAQTLKRVFALFLAVLGVRMLMGL
ncbi:MAG: sulfite exporter TauE/SafE family protein [Pseudomonadota bacterium]|nr:MAG: sulfite exporter TauE/SafE family protein [Pseudomonadota bacterium]